MVLTTDLFPSLSPYLLLCPGMMMAMFQSVLNSASNAVFGAVKPFMLSEAYSKITTKINEALDNATKDFVLPNSISPLDMAIAEGRKKIRQMG